MAVNLRCPNLKCRKILKVPSSARGQRVRCFFCSTILRVPQVGEKPKTPPSVPVPSTKEEDAAE